MNAIELSGVTKTFGTQTAVDKLDLVVPTGSIFGFIGPNGSGKTTTMRMILRIYKPDAGRVCVLGDDHHSTSNDRIGYLPEERGLYRRMTVRRVLKYFAKLKGIANPNQEIEAWLTKLAANDWADKRIEQLSKGMAQKIQFIVAVIARPELVILDEPFSGLDPVNMEVLRDAVFELRDNGATVIFSTHDMDVAEKMCDRVFMIYRGKKVLDDSIDTIKESHGTNRLRVRMTDNGRLPSDLPGILDRIELPKHTDLITEHPSHRNAILRRLAETNQLEHFEIVRPSLHDIFVQIARPEPNDMDVSV
jgi:ABC-2 type transport system ATP-binding protein